MSKKKITIITFLIIINFGIGYAIGNVFSVSKLKTSSDINISKKIIVK